jgi:hypothetical protein
MKTQLNEPERGTIKIGVHKGNMLYYMAHAPENPSDVIAALVQNALDKKAKHIYIIVNAKTGTLHAWDDGQGASLQEIEQVWSNVGLSIKLKDPTQIGQKGLDKLASLSIVSPKNGALTWITRPLQVKGSRYIKINLKKNSLPQNDEPDLPYEILPMGFGYGEPKGVGFKPTTCVELTNVLPASLKELGDIEEIAETIGERYARTISIADALVRIIYRPKDGSEKIADAKPQEFPGTPQKPFIVKTTFGQVEFRLYSTIKAVRFPRIFVDYFGKDKFHLRCLHSLWKDVEPTLGSGHFQGHISVNFCTLRYNRKGFEEDEESAAFAEVVRAYVAENCPIYLEAIRDRSRSERHAEIIRSVVSELDGYFKNRPDLQLGSIFKGLVSDSHSRSNEAPPNPEKMRLRAPSFVEAKEFVKAKKEREKERKKHPAPPPTKKGEYDGVTHSSSEHPLGYQRREVKSQFGITVKTTISDDRTGHGWHTRFDNGIIYFNVEHPDWNAAENSSMKRLRLYVQHHLCKELSMQFTDNPNERKCFERLFVKFWMPFSSAFE